MGKCEKAKASLGLKMKVSSFVAQILHMEADFVEDMIEDGFIDDSNGYFNESFFANVFWELARKYLDFYIIDTNLFCLCFVPIDEWQLDFQIYKSGRHSFIKTKEHQSLSFISQSSCDTFFAK